MNRRVRWQTRAVADALDGLVGVARLRDDLTLPVVAALRALQRATGCSVTSFGGLGRSVTKAGLVARHYSVTVNQAGHRRRVLLTVEPFEAVGGPTLH